MAALARQNTQDVKVTNDDEEKENWSDHDDTYKHNKVQPYILYVCVTCLKLEVIKICGEPLLGFFEHESCFTHPVEYESSPACFTAVSTWDR